MLKLVKRCTSTVLGLALFATAGSAQVVLAAGNVDAGKQVYQMRCSPCHGPDGKAETPTAKALTPKPRDHTDGAYMNQLSNDQLTKVIKNGGASIGKAPIMPPHPDLNDQQVQDIIAFVRTLANPSYKGN
jgi:mono/diheme cytochrome c family protein